MGDSSASEGRSDAQYGTPLQQEKIELSRCPGLVQRNFVLKPCLNYSVFVKTPLIWPLTRNKPVELLNTKFCKPDKSRLWL